MRDISKYMLGGIRLPSVTEILQLAGLVDFSGIPFDTLEAARMRGEEVHEWLALEDQGFLEGEQPSGEIAGYVEAYHRFKADAGFVPELIEQPVVNPTYHYAGTVDRTGKLGLGAKPALVELKAVAQVGPETALQTMGYALCLPEPRERFALQLRADGTYRLYQYFGRGDRDDWYAAVRIAHWKLRNERGKIG